MRLKEDFNEIVVQETPGCLWLFGSFFAVIGGIFVYGSLGGFTNSGFIPAWQLALAFLMGAISVTAGILIIYHAPITKVFINRRVEKITLKRFGLFGRKTQTYAFEQLKCFTLIEERDDESNPIWSLGMELADGETVKISSLPAHSDKLKRDLVFQINEFMHKPLPSYRAFDESEDESAPKIS